MWKKANGLSQREDEEKNKSNYNGRNMRLAKIFLMEVSSYIFQKVMLFSFLFLLKKKIYGIYLILMEHHTDCQDFNLGQQGSRKELKKVTKSRLPTAGRR